MKPQRLVLAFSLAAATLSTSAYFALRQPHAHGAAVTSVESAKKGESGRLVAWPKGSSYRYAFTWKAASSASLQAEVADGPMSGSAEMSGEMVLGAIADRPGGRLLSVRFENVTKHHLELLGKELVPSDEDAAALFKGREAYVELSERGAVGTIYFRKDDPSVWKHVTEMVLNQLTISLPGDDAAVWTLTERAPSGEARSHYKVNAGDPLALVRTREAYETLTAVPPGVCGACAQSLEGTSTIRLDPRGVIRELRADESLRVDAEGSTVFAGTSQASIALLSIDPLEIAGDVTLDMNLIEAKTPGQLATSEESRHAVLVRLAGDLTPATLEASLRRFTSIGVQSIPDGWITKAAALLKLEPSLCQSLAVMFEEPSLALDGRAMILDVLAAAGSREAQAAMRDALESPAASIDPGGYVRLVQRLSFVQTPDVASSAFLAREYARESNDRDTRFASAFALGATLSRLGPAASSAEARAMGDKLRDDLRASRDTVTQRALLTALGNAGRASDTEEIKRYAHAESPEVRRAAASALRKSTAHEAQSALLDLVGDPDADVQHEALRSLSERPLTSEDAERLGALVTSGASLPESDSAIVLLLGKHLDLGDASRGTLEAILARTGDHRLEARIRMILDAMRPRG